MADAADSESAPRSGGGPRLEATTRAPAVNAGRGPRARGRRRNRPRAHEPPPPRRSCGPASASRVHSAAGPRPRSKPLRITPRAASRLTSPGLAEPPGFRITTAAGRARARPRRPRVGPRPARARLCRLPGQAGAHRAHIGASCLQYGTAFHAHNTERMGY